MHPIDYLYKLFDESERRAKNSYKPKKRKKDKRTARSSSLYNAMKIVRDNSSVG